MAENIWTKVSTHKVTGTTYETLFEEGCNFIASRFGLSLYKAVDSNTKIYSFGATGLLVKMTGSEMIDCAKISGSIGYKNSSGDYESAMTYTEFSDVRIIKDSNIICERANLNGIIMQQIGDEKYGMKGKFCSLRVTDYFSSDTRSCILSGSNIISYNSIDFVSETFTKVIIGAERYPKKRKLSVAAPVILASDTFYGYVDNSTLYHIVRGSEDITIGGYLEKTVLDGKKFIHIGDGYHFL